MPRSIEEIGSCIRAERSRLNMSRAELAEASGIPAATIETYENGKSRITLENAWILADLFNMSIDALFGRKSA